MKRIAVYSFAGERLFSGNMSDLPFDDAEVNKEAENRYGEKLCPQRLAIVKQTLLAGLFDTDLEEITIPEENKYLLKHKNAFKVIVYND